MEETFSFLTANTEEQEEFLQRIKDMSGYENSQALTVESVFQFMPLTETISVNSTSTSPLDQHDDEASNSSISSSSSSTHSEAPTSFSQISPQTVPLVSAYNSINNSRQWKLIHLSPLLASRITNSGASVLSVQQILDDMHIEIRTRSEKAATAMPERLYSSLKYEFKQKLSHNFSESQVLMAKIQVVNPQEPTEEMLKTNGQTLLKGLSDMTVLSRTGLGYESKSKVQFTDVSYHFENKHFAIKITYFDPSYNIEEPIMILMSSPFKVFARRPSSSKKEKKQTPIEKKKVVTTNTAIDMKKRKLNETIQETNKKQRIISATTPAPLVQSIELKKAATMKDFLECLELLAAFKKTLTKDEQKVALQLAKQKLFTSQEEAITMQ